jgi:hypothetical protein
MERSVAVVSQRIRRRSAIFGLASLLFAALPAFGAQQLWLVVSVESHVTAINYLHIQKLFLGLTVVDSGQILHPLRNEADSFVRQVFFQNIISMSESAYERRVLDLTLQQGRAAPPVFRSTKALFDAIAADPAAVSYAWDADVDRDARIRRVRMLWSE